MKLQQRIAAWLSLSLFLFVGAAWIGGPSARAAEPARAPNIVFIFGDDWAWPQASCLETPQVRTPTFDRLVREGVLFRNTHCAAPSCAASRAAILTGQWPWRLAQGANLRGFISQRFDVYPDLLEKAGYFVGYVGKGYAPGELGDRMRNPAGPTFRNTEQFFKDRPAGKPFCFWYGSHNPHRGYERGSGRARGFDPAKVEVPPYLPDNVTVRNDIADYYAEVEDLDNEAASVIAALEKSGELDNTLIVMSGDNGWPFPRCKANLYLSGTRQPLAIRWGAKIKAGRTIDDFVSLADLCPTFLEAAGVAIPKAVTARSLLPLLAAGKSGQIDPARDHTLTAMEVHVPCRDLGDGFMGGYPMRSIVTANLHYIRNFKPDRWPAGDPEGVKGDPRGGYRDIDSSPTKVWMLEHRQDPAVAPLAAQAFDKRAARELYDVTADPYELKNVAEDPRYAEQVQRLDAQLMAELSATGDPRARGSDELERYAVDRPENLLKKGKADAKSK